MKLTYVHTVGTVCNVEKAIIHYIPKNSWNPFNLHTINSIANKLTSRNFCKILLMRVKFLNFAYFIFGNEEKFTTKRIMFFVKSILSKNIKQTTNFTIFFFTKSSNYWNTVWHIVEKKKNGKFTLTQKIFRQINYLVILLVKPLLSRNFCQKCMRVNFP